MLEGRGKARRFAVVTSGHSGSNWLISALDRPELGIAAFHEPMRNIGGGRFHREIDYAVGAQGVGRARILELLGPYEAWLRRRLTEFDVVGEVHTGPGTYLREIVDRLPELRVLLVRNGIQTVHSLAYGTLWNGTPSEKGWSIAHAPARCREAGDELAIFGGTCAAWAAQQGQIDALGLTRTFRLEDLVSDTRALQDAAHALTGRDFDAAHCARIRLVDSHRKVQGDNGPANLFWNIWSEAQRELFLEVCGRAMEAFGYCVPERADAPEKPDLRPKRPKDGRPTNSGVFSTMWIFESNPRAPLVLVCGEPKMAHEAVKLLHPARAMVLADPETGSGAPTGYSAVGIDEVARRGFAGVYVADPAPDPARVARLEALLPDAEIVGMPAGEDVDDLLRASAAKASRRYVDRCGPLVRGDVHAGFRITAIGVLSDRVAVSVATDEGARLELDLQPELPGRTSPFALPGGALYYREAGFEFERIRTLLSAVHGVLASALAGRTLPDALAEWCAEGART